MKKITTIILSALSLVCCNRPESCVVGNIDIYEEFQSQHVAPRTLRVWRPSDYNPEQKYAVIYMHDGQNLFDASITWNQQEWGVDECISGLLEAGEIRPCIVVGIDNISDIRYEEYYPSAICSEITPGVLPEGFKPLGGLISSYALCEYPEVFGGAGCNQPDDRFTRLG